MLLKSMGWVKKKMKDNNRLEYDVIDTPDKLKRLAERLETETAVGIDLEADSMFHFREKVCLIQMASENFAAVIDPLRTPDLSVLRPFFADPNKKKVLHGADYDVRSLHRDFDIKLRNLFDTELASRFLGVRESGLEAVLSANFGVQLDKSFQKKDWSKRPLPAEMVDYAARDVIYLVPLADMLEKELAEKGRLGWVREECDYLSQVRAAPLNNAPLFKKFKGAGRMRPRDLAVLENILKLRLDIAEKRDRPPFKVMGNKAIAGVVDARPNTLKDLKNVDYLSKKQVDAFGRDLLSAVRDALSLPETDLPTYPRRRPDHGAGPPGVIKSLKKWRTARADALDMDPGLICNNALIGVLAAERPKTPDDLDGVADMKEWQKKTFGRDIVKVINNGRA